jgi:branched-chain amino acid transport system permease protein
MPPRRIVLPLVVAGLAACPFVLNAYLVFIISVLFVYVILALGLNLLLGYAGQFAFANAAFFGIGAYATALLKIHLGVSFWLGLPLGGLITALIGVVVGLPALRLSGLYLAMATLAFAQLVQWVLIHWQSFTFGAGGIKVPPPGFGPSPFSYATNVYFLCLAVALVAVAATWNLVRSRIGRALVAIRDSEVAAQALGVDLARYKTVAFALSAFYAGIAGGLHSALLSYVAPEGYSLFQMVIHFAMVVVGGLGSVTGSVLGAALLTALPEVLRTLKSVQEIAFGAILMLCIIFLPDGLYGVIRRRLPAWQETLHRAPAGSPPATLPAAATPDAHP